MAQDELNNDSYEERKRILEEIREIEKQSSYDFRSVLNFASEYNTILGRVKSLKGDINTYQQQIVSGEADGKKLTQDEINLLQKKVVEYQKIVNTTEQITKNVSKTKIVLQGLTNQAKSFANSLDIYDYLMEADGAIRQMNRDLGVSGQLSEVYRDNIESAAFNAARLGVSIKDLTEIQMSFVETTGKLMPLTQAAFERTSALAKATGMAASDAGELVGYFNTIGISAEGTASFVEKTLNSSEKMGINGVKTVKLIKDNFDKINKFRFQNGVEAFKQMVQFSQKVNQNLEGVFNAADKFRTLEGAIEATAELQTLGGAMAKADAFELGFLSRNNPEKFAEKLHELTTGVYTFNKATGQFSASAVDMDRLRRLAEITGQDFEALNKEARKAAEIQLISSKTFGLSKEDKDLVAQLAQFDESSKTFKLKVDGKDIDIDKLTDQQLNLLKDQQKSLEQRSKASQTFDETFQNTIMQLKTTLLPILELINKMLSGIDGFFGDNVGGLLAKLTLIGGSIGILKYVSSNLGNIAGSLIKMPFSALGKLGSGGGGAIAGKATELAGGAANAGAGTQSLAGGLNAIPDGKSLMGKAAGMAAIGVAAVGIGAGIWLAAKGVSAMADSFAKLTPEQINGVLIAIGILGATMVALGYAGTIAGPGLIAVGAGVLLIGGGVFLAATGMSFLMESMQGLTDPNLGSNMMGVAMGIGAIASSSMLIANPLTIAGFAALTGFLNVLQSTVDFSAMDRAFANASAFMTAPSTNLDKLKETLATLKDADTGMLSEMKNLFGKPLEVKFKDKEVAINLNATLQIDGDVLAKNLQIGKRATLDIVNFRRGT